MSISAETLRSFVPMTKLHEEALTQLASKACMLDLSKGVQLYDIDSVDDFVYYILEGRIEMIDRNDRKNVITASSIAGRYAIGGLKPRPARAIIDSKHARIIQFDSGDLDIITTWSQQVTNYGVEIESGPIDSSLMVDEMEVNELDENATEWMMGLLRCETFHKVPPANIQRLAVAMEPIEVKQGDVIIRQNDPGDYYYVIRQGHCKITRSDNLLAKLGPLQAFGEEALASGARRNATVTMTSDGLLMRLSKEDFDEILRPPLIHSVELSEIKPLLHKGAILLDVRTRAEYKQQRLIRSLNLPLDILRKKIHKLNHDKHYIIYCDTGARSSAATFLLTQMGFHAVLLNHPENAFRTITAS